MPATQFFAMRKAASIMQAHDRMALCDIAAIPLCKPEWHEKLKESYRRIAGMFEEVETVPAFAAESDDAKYGVMSMIARRH
jgi:hypothetical protein